MVRRWVVLLLAFAALVALVTSCGDGDEEGAPADGETPTVAATATASPTSAAGAFAYGVASGDVTDTSVILWTRVDEEGEVTAEVALGEQFEQIVASQNVQAKAEDDFVVKASIEGLEPSELYFYRFLTADGSASPVGTFLMAPIQDTSADVIFAYSGDSNAFYKPFQLLSAVRQENPDFFIYLGDTIYADDDRIGIPAATTLEAYRERYKINREDEHLRDLLAAASTYAMWDDHEVVNDFAAETVDPDMLAAGRQAFFDYMPIRQNSEDPNRLYRSFRWGKDVELFILDERQYRSAEAFCLDEEGETEQFPTRLGDQACQEGLSDPSRTFLGREQMEWLKQALLASEAKFKFIISEVSLSEFLLLPYDRWEGYPAEREELLNFLIANDIKNVVFLVTDLHAAIVNTLENGSKEIVVGPIGMDPLGMELNVLGVPVEFLEGLLPDIEYYELNTFNYGLVRVIASETPARVVIEIKDAAGGDLKTVEIVEE